MFHLSRLLLLLASLTILGCAVMADMPARNRHPGATVTPPPRTLTPEQYRISLARGEVSFVRDVQPILANRCVACHGCYDAPCQLKLESGIGLDRGANKAPVYNGTRLEPVAPTRLGVDATTVAEWRNKDFFPVLNENRSTSEANLANSVLAQMLLLKRRYPLPTSGPLSAAFDFSLDRDLSCPRQDEFRQFAEKHPQWGMPYGLPGLPPREHHTLMTWLKQGARYPTPPPPAADSLKDIAQFEAFLNVPEPKPQLVSRYVYEHLFMGHLHFEGHDDREFFRLVRSRTPPGQDIDEIATVRPYGDPGPGPVYYRLKPFQQVIVDKNHMVYEIGRNRLQRWRELFLTPAYPVARLPGYAPAVAANPFIAFAAIPPESRYRFMLDDAYFFIAGFMKGPVCRGQVALNVIRDRFWVLFYDPDQDPLGQNPAFLNAQAENLSLPTEKQSEIDIPDLLFTYGGREKAYLKAKNDFLVNQPGNVRNSLAGIWDGDGHNQDAALTVFRHFDSASLSRGFVGDPPLTTWALDYPLFERIHYLLVAGFDVFGSVKHQAATRLFMDHLRNEAENNFLSLLPARDRPALYHFWYRGFLADLKSDLDTPYYGYGKDSAIVYVTGDHRQELYRLLRDRLGAMAGPPDLLNDCRQADCDRPAATALERQAETLLRPLAALQGGGIQYLPELSYIRVATSDGSSTAVYSLAKNEALRNVAFMFNESSRRVPQEDTVTLAPGFIGSYPNFFFDVTVDQLPNLVAAISGLQRDEDMTALAARFGVRRTHPGFWAYADYFNARYQRANPVTAGLFDLNRYINP